MPYAVEHRPLADSLCLSLFPVPVSRPNSRKIEYFALCLKIYINVLTADRVSTGCNAIALVRLSVRSSVSTLTFEPSDLFCMCMGHDRSCPGTEGQRSRSKVNAVGLTWILSRGQFSSFV